MAWYYAGPDAKPVGPLTLDEIKARQASGVISAETYVIEYVGAPNDPRSWKRYREVFPAAPPPPPPASLPPLPPAPAATAPSAPPVPPPAPAQAHPLFPSAAPVLPAPQLPPGAPPLPRHNPWCLWGFWFGLASLALLFLTCGLSSLLALPLPALVISGVGLYQVQHDLQQKGRNHAIGGLIFAGIALVITIIIIAVAVPAILKSHGLITATEQSTLDSE